MKYISHLSGVTPRRLRVCHVITKAHPLGGAQIDTLYAVQHQQAHHDVRVIAGNAGPLIDACRARRIDARVIHMQNVLVGPFGDFLALIRLVRSFRSSRPDIVHTHTSKAGILGRLAARLAGVPVVIHTVHSPPFHDRQRMPIHWAIRRLESVWGHLTDHFIAVSNGLAAEFTALGICDASRMSVIPSPIDLDAFPPRSTAVREAARASLGLRPDDCVVVSVAELARDKGHDPLITAASAIDRLNLNVVFLIVGSGSLHEPMRARIESLGLERVVRLCGHRHDVPAVLAAADVFIQTSYREGLSRSLVEALWSGLAVVATDVGGTAEVVVQGENGLLIPPGDATRVTLALRTLIEDPKLRADLGREARRSITSTRGMASTNSRLDDLYAQLWAKHLTASTQKRAFGFLRHGAR